VEDETEGEMALSRSPGKQALKQWRWLNTIYTVRQKKRNQFSSVCIFFNA